MGTLLSLTSVTAAGLQGCLGKSNLDSSMPSSGTLKDLSLSQHFRMMVICLVLLQVLLQAVSVAVTYMYFTNEMKQVSSHVLLAAACLGFAS